jgi:GTPase SAR1 family protein
MNYINYTFNILITGNNNVGKTSLIKKYTNKDPNNHNINVFDDNCIDIVIWLDNYSIKLNIYEDSPNNHLLYSMADVILILCDIIDDQTYNFNDILTKIRLYSEKNIDYYIVNNKIDKINLFYDKKEYTNKYHNISVKTNYGINTLFKMIIRKLIDDIHKRSFNKQIEFNNIEHIIVENNKKNKRNFLYKIFKYCL